MCRPSPVKVDKDRQMVVLEEEFQVRGWGGWDPQDMQRDWETQGARSLALGARETWRSSPSSAVTLGKELGLYGSLFLPL